MMLFALAGRSSKWGSWGLVEWIDAPTGNYPKYMGTLDYLGSVPPAEEPEMPGVPILLNVERDSSVRGRVQINWTYDGPEAEIETRVRLQNLSAIMESPVTESPHEIDLREVGPLPDTAFWADFKIVAQNDVGMQESDVIRMDWPAVDIPPADGGDATAFEGRVTEIERILTELQDAHGVVAGRLDDHFQRITALLARLDSLEPVVGEAMQAADSALEVIAAIHEATKP